MDVMSQQTILTSEFFDRDPIQVAKDLLGKVLCHKVGQFWLSVMMIETEAYYMDEKGSHASQGWTPKRNALFMPPGTLYMYYARGGDSLNISCRGTGNAVLCKSGVPYPQADEAMVKVMQQLNPLPGSRPRRIDKLGSGQTLLCRSLHLKVKEWDQQSFDFERLYFKDVGYRPKWIVQTTRMGIPQGRDEHLPYRFIDYNHIKSCTKNPLTPRQKTEVTFIEAGEERHFD